MCTYLLRTDPSLSTRFWKHAEPRLATSILIQSPKKAEQCRETRHFRNPTCTLALRTSIIGNRPTMPHHGIASEQLRNSKQRSHPTSYNGNCLKLDFDDIRCHDSSSSPSRHTGHLFLHFGHATTNRNSHHNFLTQAALSQIPTSRQPHF